MAESGRFYIDNAFRVGIAKRAYRWTHIVYIDGAKLRCRRIRTAKAPSPMPIGGNTHYTAPELASKLISMTSLTGAPIKMTRKAHSILTAVAGG